MNEQLGKVVADLRSGAAVFDKAVVCYPLRMGGGQKQLLSDISGELGLSYREVLLLGLEWLGNCLEKEDVSAVGGVVA